MARGEAGATRFGTREVSRSRAESVSALTATYAMPQIACAAATGSAAVGAGRSTAVGAGRLAAASAPADCEVTSRADPSLTGGDRVVDDTCGQHTVPTAGISAPVLAVLLSPCRALGSSEVIVKAAPCRPRMVALAPTIAHSGKVGYHKDRVSTRGALS